MTVAFSEGRHLSAAEYTSRMLLPSIQNRTVTPPRPARVICLLWAKDPSCADQERATAGCHLAW